MKESVVIRKSKIAGLGVFAGRDFAKGETVMVWHPKNITEEQFAKTSPDEKYVIYKVDGSYIQMQAPEKYLNHSCNSNTRTDGLKDVAIRAIKMGEEITGDYNNDGVVSFQCNCRSKNCRGVIS